MKLLRNIFTIDQSELNDMKVEKKVNVLFNNMIVRAALVAVFLTVALSVSFFGLKRTYLRYLTADNLQGEIRIDIQALSKHILWAISANTKEMRKSEIEAVEKNMAGYSEYEKQLEDLYSNKEIISSFASHIKTIQNDCSKLDSMLQDENENDEVFTFFNETLYPHINDLASDLKTISSDLASSAKSAYIISMVFTIISFTIAVFTIITAVTYIHNARKNLVKSILRPVNAVSNAAHDMASGKMNISVDYSSDDELGELANDLQGTVESIGKIVADIRASLGRMAEGDFSVGTEHPELYVEDYSQIKDALNDISKHLSNTMHQVRDSSEKVAESASKMSDGAQALADGVSDQVAAIDQLTANISTVMEQSKNVSESANESNEMTQMVKDDVDTSARKMKLVTDAMTRITEASHEIELVTNTIESIAKQTQLLSLNASIEAARAGDAGKGFAVVAEEISLLANQSSEAAKNTHQLISDTLDEIRNGNEVVDETKAALEKVVESVNNASSKMLESGQMAADQVISMEQISEGIDQISGVVSSNSDTAQESNEVSRNLSEQSEGLNELIERFKLQA